LSGGDWSAAINPKEPERLVLGRKFRVKTSLVSAKLGCASLDFERSLAGSSVWDCFYDIFHFRVDLELPLL